jgi:hypothetical protein
MIGSTIHDANGLSEKKTEGKNFQTQTAQTHAGKSPQEAFALQIVTLKSLGPLRRFA